MPVNLLDAALAAVAALAIPAATVGVADWTSGRTSAVPGAETVEIAAGAFDFPLPGEFLLGGRPAPAPVEKIAFERPFRIMRHQVSLADYQRCVDAGACAAADARPSPDAASIPVTGINHLDAQTYAAWYSGATGEHWRLPTAAEWAYAAGERFSSEAYAGAADDPKNPAVAWIRRYREEAAARREPDPEPRRRGFYGANAKGVEDMAGNVWEWTSTCYVRVALAEDGRSFLRVTENCGVRLTEGHRAFMSNFIRDGKSGGCAVGTPPDNLGLRLVRDEGASPLVARLWSRISRAVPGAGA